MQSATGSVKSMRACSAGLDRILSGSRRSPSMMVTPGTWLQEPAAVGEHDGVVVDVCHPCVRGVPPGELMHVGLGRQSRPYVNELCNACALR